VIGRGGRDIAKKDAMKHVKGYFLGIDMTARELQDEAKKKGLPWSIAKGLDTFAPTSDLIDAADIPDVSNVELWLSVNGKDRQRGNTSDMLFDVPTIISYISERFRLEEGDCIFTGTPEGVGAVVAGDVIKAGLIEKTNGKELAAIKFDVAPRPAAKL
jgi:acylpyruvate hydrolase